LTLSDGSRLKADHYVFACGPWLGKLFPETLGKIIRPTKQDIFFFGPPAGDSRFAGAHLPVWGDHHGKRFFYGIPGSDRRGFKVADDTRGPAFDPTIGRARGDSGHAEARSRISRLPLPGDERRSADRDARLPVRANARQHFIVDRHPRMDNVWLLGGGSGHGFKHGPALGEMMADLILKDGEPENCLAVVAILEANNQPQRTQRPQGKPLCFPVSSVLKIFPY
jgi:sarcosine oxidase